MPLTEGGQKREGLPCPNQFSKVVVALSGSAAACLSIHPALFQICLECRARLRRRNARASQPYSAMRVLPAACRSVAQRVANADVRCRS
jgi:hypothetical protein